METVVLTPQFTKCNICETGSIVTGGNGALGLLTSRWLVHGGAVWLVMLSRSGNVQPTWDSLTLETTSSLCMELCDTTSPRQIHRSAECNGSILSGVVHAAGVLADASLLNQTQAGLQRVWAPKAKAAWSLHRAAMRWQQQMFVVFSSVSALLGGAGQANYAAANSSLDGLVRMRHECGQTATSMQWGAWAGAGTPRHVIHRQTALILSCCCRYGNRIGRVG